MGSLAKNRFLWMVVLLALGAAFWGALQVASAHNIGWKWDTSDAPVVSNLNTPYNSKIMSAKRDYDNNTDLSVDSCNQPCTESILHVYQYFSGVDWPLPQTPTAAVYSAKWTLFAMRPTRRSITESWCGTPL